VTGQGQPALFPRAENQPLAPAPPRGAFLQKPSVSFPADRSLPRAGAGQAAGMRGLYPRFRLKLFGNSFAYGFIASSDCQYNLAYFLKKRYDVKI
jgi:hypothetical protein